MNLRKRLISAAGAAAFLILLLVVAVRGQGDGSGTDVLFGGRETINVWYADSTLTDFFQNIAASYNESQSRYRVEPTLVEDNNYLDYINQASVAGEDYPDVYVLGNNNLGRAYKAGLASAVTDVAYFSDNAIYPQSAINAVACDGKIAAYPMYFETAAFVYNTEYLQSMADAAGVSLEDAVPHTMIDVIKLANSYDAPQEVTGILKWDVSDIFLNYAFVGNYLTIGSLSGDNVEDINLYNANSIQSLQAFQQLSQFFAVDTTSDSYDSIVDDFANGHLVFTIATTDLCAEMERRKAAGESYVEYGAVEIPDATQNLLTKSMNVTDCLVVNGYSDKVEAANRFVRYVLFENMAGFYTSTGKAPAMRTYAFEDAHMNGFYDAYVDSVPITKLREASNFWMLLENTFANVWDGADANEELRSLQQQMMIQITGDDGYTVEAIADPEYVDLSAELSGGD